MPPVSSNCRNGGTTSAPDRNSGAQRSDEAVTSRTHLSHATRRDRVTPGHATSVYIVCIAASTMHYASRADQCVCMQDPMRHAVHADNAVLRTVWSDKHGRRRGQISGRECTDGGDTSDDRDKRVVTQSSLRSRSPMCEPPLRGGCDACGVANGS